VPASVPSSFLAESEDTFLSAAVLRRNWGNRAKRKAMIEMAVGDALRGFARVLFARALPCLTLCIAVLPARWMGLLGVCSTLVMPTSKTENL
jgi:hypothetical protein